MFLSLLLLGCVSHSRSAPSDALPMSRATRRRLLQGGPPPDGGGGSNVPTSTSSHAASMLGEVALTTIGVDLEQNIADAEAHGTAPLWGSMVYDEIYLTEYDEASSWVGTTIAGPFEAGIVAGQDLDFLLTDLGCATADICYTDGGIDLSIALRIMNEAAGLNLPYTEGTTHYGFVDQCGGHSGEPTTAENGANYHFHLDPFCLYNPHLNATGHSIQFGTASDDNLTPIYGKWEDTNVLPVLDACGAHYGFTPDSPDVEVYHHHTQDNPPYSIGCYGPNDDGSMVTVQQCRDFYEGCDGDLVQYSTTAGQESYDLWCPCFDANVSNTGVDIEPLAFNLLGASDTTSNTTGTATADPASYNTAATVASYSPVGIASVCVLELMAMYYA